MKNVKTAIAVSIFLAVLAVGGAGIWSVLGGDMSGQGDRQVRWEFKTSKPKGAAVLLGKDAIPAIFSPQFVSASEANMPDDAHVIGVAIGDEARAYSINLLDGHEIVNDVVGGKKIATTW